MCNIEQLYAFYHAHTGYPTSYHLHKVREARMLIDLHKRTCPECRGDGMKSNYNLVEPAQTGFKRQPGRKREMEARG